MAADEPMIDEQASESLAVAPPPPGGAAGAAAAQRGHAADDVAGNEAAGGGAGDTAMTHVRAAQDASDNATLARNPGNEDAKLDVALDETFPTSDAPSNTQPGKGMDPAPSSGFDADAEKARMSARE